MSRSEKFPIPHVHADPQQNPPFQSMTAPVHQKPNIRINTLTDRKAQANLTILHHYLSPRSTTHPSKRRTQTLLPARSLFSRNHEDQLQPPRRQRLILRPWLSGRSHGGCRITYQRSDLFFRKQRHPLSKSSLPYLDLPNRQGNLPLLNLTVTWNRLIK